MDSRTVLRPQKEQARRRMSGHRQSLIADPLERVLGSIPYRLQLAGGWIDQPFVSQHNPRPPGSMVVVQIQPTFRPMPRSGLAGSTRTVASKLWGGRLPNRPPADLVRELYQAENQGKIEPSGSQDMIGLVYPGINRLDYNHSFDDGIFPVHIESLNQTETTEWLETVIYLVPLEPRPNDYNPLGKKQLDPEWVASLGQSGKDCFEAIRMNDVETLGQSFNLCMKAWEKLLPHVIEHPLLDKELKTLLRAYQELYPGAMFSGCGGGYLIVASLGHVPGALKVDVRVTSEESH
jgi:hypothetical protein